MDNSHGFSQKSTDESVRPGLPDGYTRGPEYQWEEYQKIRLSGKYEPEMLII